MQCKQVKANLVHYLAKEYQFFNLKELEAHLSRCSACREELAGLTEIDRILCRIPHDYAPPDFAAGIMSSIRCGTSAGLPVGKRWWVNKAFARDLVAAAAVTIILSWSGGHLFDSRNVDLASQKLDNAVQTYVSYSEQATTRTYDVVGSLSEQLLVKEWNSK